MKRKLVVALYCMIAYWNYVGAQSIEQSEIRKAGKGGDIFGVQIKQNFFSSNYGDVGYLFLIVDLNNVEEPIIHVRTWQPEITINDSLYDLSNFN